MGLRGPKARSVADRFWEKVEIPKDPDACWRWLASHMKDGRPQFYPGPPLVGMRPAFWTAYTLAFGPIPEGATLDHLCDNNWCVNPNHLHPTTTWDNYGHRLRDQSTCLRGHPLSEAYVRANGRRQCRECSKHAQRERRERHAIAEGRVFRSRGRRD